MTVDGNSVEPVLVGDCMLAVPLTQGAHQVAFRYHNAAFSLGWKISLGCALIFASAAAIVLIPRRQRGKFEKRA